MGIGTGGIASMRPVSDALAGWMAEHPDDSVKEIFMDFTDVDYRWGDAPVSCLIPFIRQGVQHVHFVASGSSAPALESLLGVVNMPWFSVERVDA
jgi:hypothetical protein